MFWALTLKGNERSDQEFPTDLHVSAVVLDVDSLSKNSKKGIQVWVENELGPALIANVCRQTTQFALDIGVSKGEKLTFFTKGGPGTVYLHGYFVPDEIGENDPNSAELAEELMNLDDNESKTNGKTSPEPDSESEVRFNDTIHDGDGSDEEKRSKRKTIKSENQQKTKTGPTRLMDDSKRARANKRQNAECPKATNKHRNDMANHPMCDALPFPGYNPYYAHWPPTGAPFTAVHPEALNYQQMISSNAFNPNSSANSVTLRKPLKKPRYQRPY